MWHPAPNWRGFSPRQGQGRWLGSPTRGARVCGQTWPFLGLLQDKKEILGRGGEPCPVLKGSQLAGGIWGGLLY